MDRPDRSFARAALLLAAAFAVCHALGLRDAVSVLSGTMPAAGGELAALGGVAYVITWLLVIAVAPILAIAAILAYVGRRYLLGRRWKPPQPGNVIRPANSDPSRATTPSMPTDT
jgi:hypothetical protein